MIIIKAAQFAAECHKRQTRKYSNRPYIEHPIRVAGRVATHLRATPSLVAAAFLHDVVEDCGVTYTELKQYFGPTVAGYVFELTNDYHSRDILRAERKRRDRERLRTITRECKIVKLIDRIDNLHELPIDSDFTPVYAKESLLLVEVLKDADSPLASELTGLADYLIGTFNSRNFI